MADDSDTDGHLAPDQGEVFAFLGRAGTHGLGEPPERIDTHAAVVFLAGGDAYKTKRAVRFPFLDFSTLDRREAACRAEIEVNRRNAPDIYLGVVPVTRDGDTLAIGGTGEVVEWLVHMRRFDPGMTLDRVAERDGLDDGLLAALVETVAVSHENAPRGEGAGATDRILRYIRENTVELLGAGLFPEDRVRSFGERGEAAFGAVRDLLLARGEAGFVRRCHGDLHLRNIALIEGCPVLFDALEFDEAMATSDVLYDLAFLLMDLWDRGLAREANTVWNRYLWRAGEPSHIEAAAALRLFMSVRAAIRAKVTAANVANLEGGESVAAEDAARHYFTTAEACLDAPAPCLVAVGGLSGTGKTTVAAAIAPVLGPPPGAVHLRSDIERKRMFGAGDADRLGEDAYAREATDEVYARLRRKAGMALGAGQAVVVDAVHERDDERAAIEAVAAAAGVPFTGVWLEVSDDEMLRRVAARRGDASDADEAVVRTQLARRARGGSWARLGAGGDRNAVAEAALGLVRRMSPAISRR